MGSFPAGWLAQLCGAGGDLPPMQAKGQLGRGEARGSGSLAVHTQPNAYTFIIAHYYPILAEPA